MFDLAPTAPAAIIGGGAIAGPALTAKLHRISRRDIAIHGCAWQAPRVFARLLEMVRAGTTSTRLTATYPLHEIALAHAPFQAKSNA